MLSRIIGMSKHDKTKAYQPHTNCLFTRAVSNEAAFFAYPLVPRNKNHLPLVIVYQVVHIKILTLNFKSLSMKKIGVLLLSLVSLSAYSQTVEEVISNYSAAMGGLDAFNKITTAKMTGTLSSQGSRLPLTIQLINGKAVRTDVNANGQSIVNVYNNGTGWKINPFANAPTATDVTGTELQGFKTQASLANNLMDYKARGHAVELLGQEDVNGTKAFKIKLTAKEDGKVSYYFISTIDYLLIKSTTKREIAGNEYNAESVYSDFRTVNRLKFCFKFTQTVEGRPFQDLTYTSVELNTPVDEVIFAKPK